MDIFRWCNSNQGFAMVLLTFVYVIATIVICIFNYKSVKATKEQVAESKRQFILLNKPNVIVGLKTVDDYLFSLFIKNVGASVANKIIVSINPEWLDLIKDEDIKSPLLELTNNSFTLIPQQELTRAISIIIVGMGNKWLDKLSAHKLIVNVAYSDNINNYSEKFEFNISLYREMFVVRDGNEKTLKEISKNISEVPKSINNNAAQIKELAKKIK